MNKEG